MRKAIVVDLEGTLSDDTHRSEYFHEDMTQDEYDIWNELLYLDPPKKIIITIITILSAFFDIYIITAKPIKYKNDVNTWLVKNTVFNIQGVLMRPDGCMKNSPELKHYLIKKLWFGGNTIVLAFDDREDVCEMYKAHKITTLKV